MTVRRLLIQSLVIITHDSRISDMAQRRFSIVDGVLSEVTAL